MAKSKEARITIYFKDFLTYESLPEGWKDADCKKDYKEFWKTYKKT